MEPTQKTKIASSIAMSVIEENNIVRSVITVDTMERSPTPIVIYNVGGELDSFATEHNNR